MARQQSGNRPESQAMESRRRGQLVRPMGWSAFSPFGMMRRLADEMDRVFEDVGLHGRMGRLAPWGESGEFHPTLDMFERDGKLIVRADLPGMTKDDVNVEITPNSVRIEGERKYEHETNEEGLYRSERSYGSFSREIPLPEGVKTENATAKFKDGVLEVILDASQMTKGRKRIEIEEETTTPKPGKSAA